MVMILKSIFLSIFFEQSHHFHIFVPFIFTLKIDSMLFLGLFSLIEIDFLYFDFWCLICRLDLRDRNRTPRAAALACDSMQLELFICNTSRWVKCKFLFIMINTKRIWLPSSFLHFYFLWIFLFFCHLRDLFLRYILFFYHFSDLLLGYGPLLRRWYINNQLTFRPWSWPFGFLVIKWLHNIRITVRQLAIIQFYLDQWYNWFRFCHWLKFYLYRFYLFLSFISLLFAAFSNCWCVFLWRFLRIIYLLGFKLWLIRNTWKWLSTAKWIEILNFLLWLLCKCLSWIVSLTLS